MAENIGRVDVLVDLDGRTFDAQARAIAQKAGQTIARTMARSYNASAKGSHALFNKLGEQMNSTERAVYRLDRSFLKLWKTLPHGFRQFSFYTALFANLGESIAVLGSAAGAGITVLAGSLVQFGIGAGVAITAFTGLNKELDELPESIRPAVKAIKDLGGNFSNLRSAIQVRALRDADRAFVSFGQTIDALVPAFETVADVVNQLVKDFAQNIAPGTKAFKNLDTLVRRSATSFDRMVRVTGKLGDALLTVFASPAFNKALEEFIGWVDLLFTRFQDFAESDQLELWFRNASRIFGSVGQLLDATGRLLNDLVDEEAIDRFVQLSDRMSEFIEGPLNDLLNILGDFDIFGLIAQALNDFGQALEPLSGPMADLAESLNAVVSAGIERLAPLFEDIAEALAPVVQAVSDFIDEDPQKVADAFIAIAGAAVVLKGASGLLGLAGRFTSIDRSVRNLKKTLATTSLVALFLAMFTPADGDTLEETWGGILGNAAVGAVAGLAVGGGPWGALIGATIAGVVTYFQDLFTDPEKWIQWEIELATTIGQHIAGAITLSAENLQIAFANMQLVWDGLWNGLLTSVFNFGVQWGLAWNGLRQTILTGIFTLVTAMGVTWNTLWQGFLTGVFAGWTMLIGMFQRNFEIISRGWSNFWGGIGAIFSTLWNGFLALIRIGWSNLQALFSGNFAKLGAGWNSFWSKFGAIVGSVWGNIVSVVRGAANTVIGIVNNLISTINGALSKIGELSGGLVNLRLPSLPTFAHGGITTGPSIAGEAGPELIIPLTGSLSSINPTARPFAEAIRGGGSGGAGRIVNVQPGAIQVVTSAPPMQVAAALLDRLAINAAV